MKSRFTSLLIISTLISCSSPAVFNLGSGKYSSKSKKRQMVTPPTVFVDAIFHYKSKNFQWPYSLDKVCTTTECYNAYRRFLDEGITSLEIEYSSTDTLIISYNYSLAKHEMYKTTSSGSRLLKSLYGYYLFVKDSSLTLFKTVERQPVPKRYRGSLR